MRNLKIVTIWLVMAYMVFDHITRIKYYQQILGNNSFGYGSSSFPLYIIIADNILYVLLDILLIVLGIASLAYSDKNIRDRMYSFFRYIYVMRSLMAMPIVIYSLITFAKYIFVDPVSIFTTVIRDMVWLTLVVFLLFCKPERPIQKVYLQDYDMVAFTSTSHRFVHYLLDVLFLLPIWMYVLEGIYNRRDNDNLLFVEFIFFTSYLFYCFLSEAIFRQTLGKMITRSCV
ncbi:MAG TPA: hypothetical protein VIM79_15890, partial [Niastella sp.]